ncbi:hypothetical protein [Sutcliffiella rhizosphaerae]|uniref:Transposase n=1 Tax=Sutcliffiella rhizosphaerae TaxID=2880967 RepID=A0ABN8ADX9_9BACI|nr:hypothetical protein [Sutcliffiella rhizosphaerae]CAG9623454.1 hypothetical protein BACCIP111883_04267 [Sutcliffiella rhizosphaerae]
MSNKDKLLELKLLLDQELSNLTEFGQKTLENLLEELEYSDGRSD